MPDAACQGYNPDRRCLCRHSTAGFDNRQQDPVTCTEKHGRKSTGIKPAFVATTPRTIPAATSETIYPDECERLPPKSHGLWDLTAIRTCSTLVVGTEISPIRCSLVCIAPSMDTICRVQASIVRGLMRKALELTPSYRAAGEDSFTTAELEAIFAAAGYRRVVWRRVNLFPNFTPQWMFQAFRRLEPIVENSKYLRALCTVNMWGFTGA